MTTKTLSGIYTATYNLTSPITTLSITATGYLGAGISATGTGVYTIVNSGGIVAASVGVSLAGGGAVTNMGTIASASSTTGAGIILGNGGVVTNAAAKALISGRYGVEVTGQSGTVANDGTIIGTGTAGYGVVLAAGGLVTNGAVGATSALITGHRGIAAATAATVLNYATVVGTGTASAGVYLVAGGVVTNGASNDTQALILGDDGILALGGATTVINHGTIAGRSPPSGAVAGTYLAGVYLKNGGVVTNGAPGETQALIEGDNGVFALSKAATVTNYGTIRGASSSTGLHIGVYLKDGGVVTNGSATATTALLDGVAGVYVMGAAGTVSNFGTIGDASAIGGILLGAGGVATNGSLADTTALVQGQIGVGVGGAAGTVRNFGTILAGSAVLQAAGIFLNAGGSAINGSTTDTTAFVQGETGFYGKTVAATVTNFGTIAGVAAGVALAAGGHVTNGTATDTGALIEGKNGIIVAAAAGVLSNFGTIRGAVIGGDGVNLMAGGLLTNGSAGDTKALIQGATGVSLAGSATGANYGTISGNAAVGSLGVVLATGAVMTNGSATDATALITGYTGATIRAGSVLSNFGTIQGTGGLAVALTDPTATLDAQAGSVFLGQIAAGAGVVDFISGVSTLSGIASYGTIDGAGTMTLAGGVSTFASGLHLTVSKIIVSGAATRVNVTATSLTDAQLWSQTAGTLSVASGDQIRFTGTGNSFAGTLAGAGTVAFVGGSDTFNGTSLTAASVTINGAAITLSGAIGDTGNISLASPSVTIAAAGATLSGGGTLSLTDTTTNKITGATGAATLTNIDILISGAGALGGGSMTLINQAAGIINASGVKALIIDTGAATVTNAGLIEAQGAGGLTIQSAVKNTGTLAVLNANMTVNGAVTGAGVVTIDNGTLHFASTFTESATFGTRGILQLDKSQTYTGTITGFSKTGQTSLDLSDIGFVGAGEATYSGTKSGGVLTVTDGTHTAHINLKGNFLSSAFVAADDGHGGVIVHDPVKAAVVPGASIGLPSAHAFIAAAASLGGATGAALSGTHEGWGSHLTPLATPRTMTA